MFSVCRLMATSCLHGNTQYSFANPINQKCFVFPALNKSADVLCTCVTGWYMFGVIEHGEVITSLLHSIGACT